jgi:hypothetical protein
MRPPQIEDGRWNAVERYGAVVVVAAPGSGISKFMIS